MRALVLRSGQLRVDEVADPVPQAGQVVARSLVCAICASDHHMVQHGHRLAEWSRDHSGPFDFDADRDLVLGHEFCAEIVDHGPRCDKSLPVGTRVVTQPTILHDRGFSVVGYSNEFPGGFGQYLVLSEAMLMPVPDDIPTDLAALAEPLSVGMQYARIADLRPGDVPLVIGCGAIGLAIIAALRWRGIGPVVAADYSPMRRQTAAHSGADVVVDPAEDDAYAAWVGASGPGSACVVFECVGAPGVLNSIFVEAPWFSRIIVAGQNLEDDVFFTAAAHTKGLNVQFGGVPIADDLANALTAIDDGSIDVGSWLTGTASLDSSVEAFAQSTDAEVHTRLVVHPGR